MRITTKVAAAGSNGLSRFPVPNATIDECLDERGKLDIGKAIKALDIEQVQRSSKDDRAVFAFALEYLTQMRSVVERLAASVPGAHATPCDGESGYRTEAHTPGDRRCERNMRRGRFAFCRTDISSIRSGLRVALSAANPREVVGGAELVAHDFALMCARILNYLKANITTTEITLVEGEGCAGVFAAARDLDTKCDLDKKRASCPNRTPSGHCSPICPDCPLYHNGKCRPAFQKL